ncbi:NosL protein [Oceaniovalibus guishaninsula JLT2003]|uniref:NosL protein n=1 Tax=Oceaniovalibus guishaninsula JLT2003 TaxID=1231392 RepID=K2GQ86_9RHOB|nr:nitrous oxide reductase accessory protein NosL [Oceaniovalibus guishaninsula]EKE44831.1 NosL protein [Oceaniovalibus guishaninsula JLT2003]
MKGAVAILALLALAGCKEDAAQDVTPLALTPAAIGHFCQMNLMEHEGPKAQVHLGGLPGAPLFFSQVRDALAYARMPEQTHEILAIWVNDMGADGATWAVPGIDNWIAAGDAVYVLGSDAVGGMGAPEIVPFSDAAAARSFADTHGGRVVTQDAIPDDAVLAPVAIEPDTEDTEFEQRLRALSRRN